jgi:SOS-response transcriptional repressor LexA
MAYRQWLPNPQETVGVRLEDEAMHPILPLGSIVAVDRSMTDPQQLQGRIVAACPEGEPVIRWLEISGRHVILRPNQPNKDHPLLPVDLDGADSGLIVGQVVWSWSRFGHS